jgi:uncharacterized membrane protein (DUF2068 family)
MQSPKRGYSAGLRTIAGIEASKGVLVLLAGIGLLELVHRDVQAVAEELVRHLHLSPSAHYPRIFLELAAQVSRGWLWLLAAGALLYASLRLVEAFGLWREKRWAKWLGAGSGAIYVPFEVVGLFEKVTALRIASLVVNLLVVYLLHSLKDEKR